MPKKSPLAYEITTDGGYLLRTRTNVPIRYERYRYSPLSNKRSIRLIRRIRKHPADNSFDNFAIENRSLDDPKLTYIPISYTWGNSSVTAPLIIHSGNHTSVCLITVTAWEAIETLCTDDVPVWIDQICIDQKNNEEKKVQIGLMGEIYSSPRRMVTAIWIGPADDETETAFQLVELLSKVMPLKEKIPVNVNDVFHESHDVIREKVQAVCSEYQPPADDDPIWASMAKLLTRTWYSRMWTFQEVVLADHEHPAMVVSANERVRLNTSLRALMRATILLGSYSFPGYNDSILENRGALRLIDMVQNDVAQKKARPLHYLLYVTASHDCQDPKDKIYSLLNIYKSDMPMDPIEVDLEKSNAEVYADTTRKIIASETSLLVALSASGRHAGKVNWLPSWIPDYSGKILAPYLEALNPNSPLFSACQGRRWQGSAVPPQSPLSWQHLSVKGRHIDIIKEIDDQIMPAKGDSDDIYAYLRGALPKILSLLITSSGESQTDAMILRIARTVIIGGFETYVNGFRAFSFMSPAVHAVYDASAKMKTASERENDDLKMLRRLFAQTPPSDDPGPANENEKQWVKDFTKQTTHCRGRRFAILEKYGISLIPHQAEKNDIVAIVHGSSLPVILRHVHGNFYNLVGPCFVDGIMFGEAVNWSEEDADSFVLI